MGCGDGSWLVHLHRADRGERTLRGRAPRPSTRCSMVGIDPDRGARERAAPQPRRGRRAGAAPPRRRHRPRRRCATTLAEHGLAIEDGLHIRAFIDHERTYRGGDAGAPRCRAGRAASTSTRGGAPLAGEEVERDLVAHLRRWAPHVAQPRDGRARGPLRGAGRSSRRHLGALHGVAFDAHQAYSQAVPGRPRRLPALLPRGRAASGRPLRAALPGEPAVRLDQPQPPARRPARASPLPAHGEPAAPRADTWRPDPGAGPRGRARRCTRSSSIDGDIRYPRGWCVGADRASSSRGARRRSRRGSRRARAGDVIRVLDYGAGTGHGDDRAAEGVPRARPRASGWSDRGVDARGPPRRPARRAGSRRATSCCGSAPGRASTRCATRRVASGRWREVTGGARWTW